MDFYPELLKTGNGTPVRNPQEWEARRKEIVDILSREEYGYLPPVYEPGKGRVVNTIDKCCSGHAKLQRVEISIQTDKGEFVFPLNYFRPTRVSKAPLFILINFRPDAYDMYYPIEEIIDNGFAVAVIYYKDVTSDDGDMENGLCGMFNRPQDGTGFGKISLWAYAASRALDYFLTLDEIDPDHVALIGHSRLGKTALWGGANDERFRYIISNDSGCAGAAYERSKHEGAETVEIITRVFPYWFCENYPKYKGKPETMPFDQHFLIAASAPRYVIVHSASEDFWADPFSEQNSCIGASPAWQIHGKKGFVGPQEQAEIDVSCMEGEIGYFRRDGVHFLGRADWLDAMKFIRKYWN